MIDLRVIQIFPIIYLGKYQHRKPNLVDRKEFQKIGIIKKSIDHIISYILFDKIVELF